MRPLPVDPPAFFNRGPGPLARLTFFALLSLALLFSDTRYRYLESVREVVAIALCSAPAHAAAAGSGVGLRGRLLRLQA